MKGFPLCNLVIIHYWVCSHYPEVAGAVVGGILFLFLSTGVERLRGGVTNVNNLRIYIKKRKKQRCNYRFGVD